MTGRLQCVVVDCPDPALLARFYNELLGGAVNRPDRRWRLNADWATLHLDDGTVLGFQRAVDYRPPRWPDPAHPQQLHLDVEVADVAEAEARVVALGATPLRTDDDGWRIYADPAGHPFCLLPAPRA